MKHRRRLALIVMCLAAGALFADGPAAWRETRTEHCVFIFQARDEEAVRELCGFAEEVYARVTSYMDTYPPEVRSIVLGGVDVANGMYTAPPHHLELYVRSPLSTWFGARAESWLKLLFIHELAHYCDLDADYGFFFVLSLVLGEGVKSSGGVFLPPWTFEGLAVLLETEFSRGGRGRNPFFEMHARAMLLDDTPFTLGHLEYVSAYPPPSRFYLFGYYFVDYLRRRFGEDVYRNIRRDFLAFPLAGPWGALRRVTGAHQDDLWNDFRKELRERFQKEAVDGEGESVTPGGFADYYSPRSTAAGWLCYRERLERAPAIAVLDPETRRERALLETGLSDESSFSVTPDGRRLAYTDIVYSGSTPSRFRAVSDLYLAELRGAGFADLAVAGTRKLTEGKRVWQPAFSPDGSRIVCVQGAGTYSRLVAVDPATGGVFTLFAEPGANVYHPEYSPDGSIIAFCLNRRGQQDICLIDAAAPVRLQENPAEELTPFNTDRIRLIPGRDTAGDYFPRFLDAQTILFTSDREGGLALYAYSLVDRGLKRVFRDRVAAFDAAPGEGGLIYSTYRANGYGLRRIVRERLEAVAVPVPADEPVPPPMSRPEIASVPYADALGFQYWIPNFNILPAQGVYHFGFGVQLLLATVMDSAAVTLSAVYYPTYHQPEFTLSARTGVGPFNLHYTLSHAFAELGTEAATLYRESFTQFLDLEMPLLDESARMESNYLSLTVSLEHSYVLEQEAPFSFLYAFSPGSIARGHFPAARANLYFSHARESGAAALYPPGTIVNSLDLMCPIPLFDERRVGLAVLERVYVTLPGLWNLSAWRLGFKAGYRSEDLDGLVLAGPRGGFPAVDQTSPVHGVFLIDYLFTIAYLDAPVAAGTHLDGLGAGVHCEIPFDADPGNMIFSIDRSFYVGAEIALLLGVGRLVVPLTVGFNLRLDWAMAEPPDADDFGLYVGLTLDSFWLGAGEARPPRGAAR